MNDDSCFVCGSSVGHFNTTNASYCVRHHKVQNTVHFECCICKMFHSKNVGALKPSIAKLCQQCGFQNKCSFLEL
jgi:hypothetical protein